MWRLLLAAFALFLPAAADADWREAETEHFRIFSDGSDKQIQRFAERVEAVDKLMRLATAAPADLETKKVRIYVVDNMREVQAAMGSVGSDVAGFYTVNEHGPLAVTPQRMGSDASAASRELILFHEYAHHFMLQYFPAAYPGWYVEGFAELVSTAGFLPNGNVAYGKAASHRQYSLQSSRWVKPSDMLVRDGGDLPRDMDFYGQSWVLTHYLTFDSRRAAQLRRYLLDLRAGKPRGEAARAFGDLAQLDRDVRKYFEAANFPYKEVPVPVAAPVIKSLRTLSPGEAALVPQTIAYRDFGTRWAETAEDKAELIARRDKYLADLRRKAERFPSDPYALSLLADAEYAAGNFALARPAIERLLSADPDHIRGQLRHGLLMLRDARDLDDAARTAKAKEARQWIVKANRAAPDDHQPLVAYYESFLLAGEKPPEAALDGLAQAVASVPQDDEVRQMLVDALAAQGDYRGALAQLAPIAASPHETPRRAAAVKQMEELAEKAGMPIVRPGADGGEGDTEDAGDER